MSSTCIYQSYVFSVPAHLSGIDTSQYLLIEQVGSSNTYESEHRRARSWQITAMGSAETLVADAISAGGSFATAGLYFGNFGASGAIKPEQYIRRVRNMISKAMPLMCDEHSVWCGPKLILEVRSCNLEQGVGDVLRKCMNAAHAAFVHGERFNPSEQLCLR